MCHPFEDGSGSNSLGQVDAPEAEAPRWVLLLTPRRDTEHRGSNGRSTGKEPSHRVTDGHCRTRDLPSLGHMTQQISPAPHASLGWLLHAMVATLLTHLPPAA